MISTYTIAAPALAPNTTKIPEGGFPKGTVALIIQNTSGNNLFYNFDNGTTFIRVPANSFKTVDITDINRNLIMQGKKPLEIVFIFLQGGAAATTTEIQSADDLPSTGIREQE